MRIPFVRTPKNPVPASIAHAAAPTALGTPAAVIDTKAAGAPRASLADIISRRTPIRWYEGVAIVYALSDKILADGRAESQIPDLADAIITPDGHVEIAARHRVHEGVQALARTLHVLLTGEQIPPPLRLLISKWIESEEPHSIKDFAQDLSYFARPDGASLIRTIYDRYLAMPELPANALIPTPIIDPPKAAAPPPRRLPRWVPVTAAVLCVGGLLLAWTLSADSSEASGSGLSQLVADGRRVLDAAREGLEQRFGLGAGSSPETPKVVATTDTVLVPRPRLRAGAPAPEIPAIAIPLARRSFDATSAPVLQTPAEPIASNAVPPVEIDIAERQPVDDSVPSVVYTLADLDVEPPQMVYPHLPRVAPSVTGPDINSMEVVVAEDGTVARVRLLSVARRMTDMMLLSGAKSWVFAPAVRDGLPVRYRITINWSAGQ